PRPDVLCAKSVSIREPGVPAGGARESRRRVRRRSRAPPCGRLTSKGLTSGPPTHPPAPADASTTGSVRKEGRRGEPGVPRGDCILYVRPRGEDLPGGRAAGPERERRRHGVDSTGDPRRQARAG